MEEARSLWTELPPKTSLEIEIGCGNGHFLSAYGKEHPDRRLIGVDLKSGRCAKSVRKINRLGLSDTHIVCGRAEDLLKELPRSCVDAFHVYFPDPWPKNKHRRRRFLRMENLEYLHSNLKPGGDLYFVTDFFDYFLQAKILLLLQNGWNLRSSNPPDVFFESMFSRRFSDLGKNLFCVHALKKRET